MTVAQMKTRAKEWSVERARGRARLRAGARRRKGAVAALESALADDEEASE